MARSERKPQGKWRRSRGNKRNKRSQQENRKNTGENSNGNQSSRNRNDESRRFPPRKRSNSELSGDQRGENSKRSKLDIGESSSSGKHREEILKNQKLDTKEFQKNRRMFCFVAGLLENFNESNKQNFDHRLEIENKIDQRLEQSLIEERKASAGKRKDAAKKIQQRKTCNSLQKEKDSKLRKFELFELEMKNLENNIATKAKPQIYYCPVGHNTATTKRLEETKYLNRIKLAEARVKLQKEIQDLDSQLDKLEPKRNHSTDDQRHEVEASSKSEAAGAESSKLGEQSKEIQVP